MAEKVLLHLIRPIVIGKWVPARIAEQWKDGFQVNAERINEKRLMKVPDEARYQDRVVGSSVKGFKEVLNPNLVSRAGLKTPEILNKHKTNLERSFKKYHKKLEAAYETVDGVSAKRFKEAVEIAQAHYASGMAKRTLPFTGTRAEGLGVGPLMAAWLTQANTAEGMLTPSDQLVVGGPILITTIALRNSFKPAINPRLIQAGSVITASEYNPSVIKAQNDETNELANRFVDPALNLIPFARGGKSKVDYVRKGAEFYFEVKVTRK